MTFPVVVLALAVVLFAGSLAQAAVACSDGARSAARALSRGEEMAVAVGRAHAVLGRAAEVTATRSGSPPGLVRVEVSLSSSAARPGGWGGGTWSLPVSCQAHAWVEPDG